MPQNLPKKGISPLLGALEAAFLEWYARMAAENNLDPNPSDPLHFYDYRGAFLGNAQGAIAPEDGLMHWPSEAKLRGHPNRFVDGVDTARGSIPITGAARRANERQYKKVTKG